MLANGTLLQTRYLIKRCLTYGDTGAVYEAEAIHLGHRPVAVKEFFFQQESLREQFQQEAVMLVRLRHDALPKVSDYFAEGDSDYLVVESIPGRDLDVVLKEKLKTEGTPFDWQQVVKWADRLLEALEYLDSQSPPIIHRDIKPQNLKLTSQGDLFLVDFGFATHPSTPAKPGRNFPANLLNYAPPEQMNGAATDVRSDLYSLGATLHHLLTGEVPDHAKVREEVIRYRVPDPLPFVHELNPQVPKALAELIVRSLALDPEQRYQSATAMRAALRQVPPATEEELTSLERLEAERRQQQELHRRQLEEVRREQEMLAECERQEAEQRKQEEDELRRQEELRGRQLEQERQRQQAAAEFEQHEAVQRRQAEQRLMAEQRRQEEENRHRASRQRELERQRKQAEERRLQQQQRQREVEKQRQAEARVAERIPFEPEHAEKLSQKTQTVREESEFERKRKEKRERQVQPGQLARMDAAGISPNVAGMSLGAIALESLVIESAPDPAMAEPSPAPERKRRTLKFTSPRVFWVAGAVAVLTVSLIFWLWPQRGNEAASHSSKQLQPSSPLPVASASPKVESAEQLQYWFEQFISGQALTVTKHELAAEQEFKLHFKPREDGYLHLLALDGISGQLTAFLPGGAKLSAGRDFVFPNGQRIRGLANGEQLRFTVLWSRQRIENFDALVGQAKSQPEAIKMISTQLSAISPSNIEDFSGRGTPAQIVNSVVNGKESHPPLIFDINLNFTRN